MTRRTRIPAFADSVAPAQLLSRHPAFTPQHKEQARSPDRQRLVLLVLDRLRVVTHVSVLALVAGGEAYSPFAHHASLDPFIHAGLPSDLLLSRQAVEGPIAPE
jgi:hypothetical protein